MAKRPAETDGRPRRRSTTAAAEWATQFDADDPSSWPTGPLLDWQVAALREAHRRVEADVADYDESFRVIDEAETGMPAGRLLLGGGVAHVLYKAGGGYIRYAVPSDCEVKCESVGCCDPRRTISAGRLL
jgi:hypothetical protein